jgi:hypothetical protein
MIQSETGRRQHLSHAYRDDKTTAIGVLTEKVKKNISYNHNTNSNTQTKMLWALERNK